MSEDELKARLIAALPQLKNLSSIVKFDLGDDGTWLVDARQGQPSLERDGTEEADCTIIISAANLDKLLNGKLDPMLAYGTGRIKVRGSMGTAMKLVAALG